MFNDLKIKPKVCDVYMRKSNDRDDRQVQSLETQEKIARKIARRNGLKIGEFFRETKSARKPEKREQFNRMIDRIRTGKCDGIICWHVNRLSRNYQENGIIHQLLEDGKIKAIYTSDKTYTADDDLVLDVEASMNARYSKDVMKNVRDGMNTKANKGWFPALAPLGYKNDRLQKIIVRDQDIWYKVRGLWDMMLTGAYTVPDIHKEAIRQNITFCSSRNRCAKVPSLNAIRGIFSNPFYYGYMKWGGKILPANHEPMITKEEWDRVQPMLHKEHSTRPKKQVKDHLFRGMLFCGDCGFAIVTHERKKTLASGANKCYHYCRCSGKRKNYECSWRGDVHEQDLLDQVIKELSRYTITPELYAIAVEAIKREDDNNVDKQRLKKVKDEISKRRSLQDSMTDKYVLGDIPKDVYERRQKSLEEEIALLEDERERLEEPKTDWREIAYSAFSFARYAREDFVHSPREHRSIIMKLLGEKLTVSVLDGTINFSPVKWLIPIKEAASTKRDGSNKDETDFLQGSRTKKLPQSAVWCA